MINMRLSYEQSMSQVNEFYLIEFYNAFQIKKNSPFNKKLTLLLCNPFLISSLSVYLNLVNFYYVYLYRPR